MRAYRLPSGRRIAPFGDPVRELHVATKTIAQWQEDACRDAGLELQDADALQQITETPALVFYDDVFFTEMALRGFVADAMSFEQNRALALLDTPLQKALGPLSTARSENGRTTYDVFWLKNRPSEATREALQKNTEPHVVEIRERKLPIKLAKAPNNNNEAPVEVHLTSRIVAHVSHWLHLLRLSHLAIGVLLFDHLRQDPWRIFKLRWAAKKGAWNAARKLNFIHPTAQVHPTADLEAAIIGPGAIVRAHAHVHSSVLGSGVEIGDHSAVVGCTLADRTQVLRGSYFALCASMPGATLSSGKSQLSLFGRDVFLTWSVLLLDAKLEGEVRVEHEGGLAKIGTPFLGACFGHRVKVGAQVVVAPGRAIPNDVVLVGPPGQTAERFLGSGPGVFVIRNGDVVPFES